MLHVSMLKKMCILLLLDGMFCKCLLNPTGLMCHLNPVLFIFSLDDLSIGKSRVLKSPTISVLLFISSFRSLNIALLFCCLLVCYSLTGLMDASPVGFQS